MFATDQQRRWWFATHPEYGHSHKGERTDKNKEEGEEPDKASPKDVDDYVENALKYETDGSVVALLESIKRNFGTEAELSREQLNLKAWERMLEDGWGAPAGTYDDGNLYISEVPRLPTFEEISRWPEKMVRGFFRWLDALLQNTPLLIDPNAMERHHRLAKKFAEYFMKCGLEVDDFIRVLRVADHRMKPDGLHTGEGRGGRWNAEWEKWIDANPPKNTEKHRDRIRKKLDEMEQEFGVADKGYLLPPRSKRK